MKIGIDCGGVLLANYNRSDGTSVPSKHSFLEFPTLRGAQDAVIKLVEIFGQENVHVVSQVSKRLESELAQWIYVNFVDPSVLLEKNIHFCEEPSGKAPICSSLGLTHFVDNRMEILSFLSDIPNLFLLQPSQYELDGIQGEKPHVTYVAEDWPTLLTEIQKTLA